MWLGSGSGLRRAVCAVAVALVLLPTACADEDGLTVVEPWVRVAVGSGPGSQSAAYFVLRNAGPQPDALLAVETAVANTAELHRVTLDDGIMRMRAVEAVPVPAGDAAVLEPGGFHVMLAGLRRELVEGDTVALTLRLRSGRTLEVHAPVLRAR